MTLLTLYLVGTSASQPSTETVATTGAAFTTTVLCPLTEGNCFTDDYLIFFVRDSLNNNVM
jgi:hypothetical protein